MQQHPVPQNVTQYQFRLVGDMTLKQFLELAAGLVVAWLFFASNLIFFIKWPLALISLLGGIAMAFFPIEERPLDVWLVNFIRSIYHPTRYVWKKTNRLPSLFSFIPHPIVEKVTATKTVKAPPAISGTPAPPTLSREEADKLKSLDLILAKLEGAASKIASQVTPTSPNAPDPKAGVSVRKLKSPSVIFKSNASPKHAPPPRPAPITIPATEPVAVEKSAPTPSKPAATPSESVIFEKPSVSRHSGQEPLATPQTIKLPASPTSPNLVVGMVVDPTGRLVENAIVQIVTKDGIPARAIKTNSLGQFFISTPLQNDTYTLEVDKDGLSFPRQSLVVKGDTIHPLLLRAT
jgi:hypothetical protein